MKTSIGLCGATGKTPELQIGQVKTVEHTQKASVEITGTRENPILNFNIPKGKDGAKLIVREYFNGDIQILNNLNELPQDTNSDKYGKTVMSVNGIKQLLEKINDVLTKANANTNAIGSLTSTVQGNKSDIELKLNNFKSETDTKVQSINQTISELEQTIETKLNEELTKQVKALQDENKKLNDMIFENSLKESFEGSTSSISDTSNGVALIETIKGQTIVTDAPTEENPNYKLIESVGDKENNKISILSHNKNLFDISKYQPTINMALDEKGNVYQLATLSGNWYAIQQYMPVDSTYIGGYLSACKGSTICYYDEQKNFLGSSNDGKLMPVPNGTKYCRFDINKDYINSFQLEEGKQSTYYVPHKEDKKEILVSLDGGLKSLPNGVCDTIEQRDDGFYLVQRIGKVVLNGSEDWRLITGRPDTQTIYCQCALSTTNVSVICDKIKVSNGNYLWNNDEEGLAPNGNGNLHCRINRSRLSTQDVDGLKQWLQANTVTVYYELDKPIETKLDINNLNLKTFKDLTYVTSENSIKPVLKGQATKDITKVIQNLQSKGAN